MRLKSMSGAAGQSWSLGIDASLERDGRGIETETVAREAVPA